MTQFPTSSARRRSSRTAGTQRWRGTRCWSSWSRSPHRPGTLYALTPTIRPQAASQEAALQTAGFTKVAVPEVQLFPGAINRVSLYRKNVKAGERLRFAKMVLLIMDKGAEVRLVGTAAALVPVDARTEPPVIVTQPGPEFQDDARPGAMILGMDRTPQGRIWGCWTGTSDKKDGYFILATSDDGAKLKILANKATGPKRILDNGIELPLEWPPRRLDPASTEPMPVPKEQRPPGFHHSLHVGDGRTWSAAVPTDAAADDYCSFFYNPFRQKWCFSIKQTQRRGRCRYYLESREFLKGANWSQAVYWTNADRLDLPEPAGRYPGAGDAPQLYSLNAVAYESLLVGMHYIHRGPQNQICAAGKFPKLIDRELGFSRDGFHGHRPAHGGFITASRTEGSWDRGYLHSTAGVLVVLDDQLVFPYTGTSGIAPSGKRGMYTGGSIGLATLRRDGFASVDATGQPGTLTTRPVTFSGTELFVNLNAPQGALQVEVLDLSENPRVLAVSQPLTADATRQRVAWTNRADLSGLAGQRVRFRFQLTNGQLYAFWISPDQSGVSNGYVGAGGPAYGGVRGDPRASRT